MTLTTNDYRTINCKLIDFEGDEVVITLWDDLEERESVFNINYIKP